VTKVPKLIAGHIVVDHTGEPWAVYRMAPWQYGVGSPSERGRVLDGVAAFAAAVPYRALILDRRRARRPGGVHHWCPLVAPLVPLCG
jgi:hypothetical protein